MEWGLAIIGAYLIAAYASRRVPRAVMWLLVGGASFAASHLYWASGYPHPIMVASMVDAAVILAIYFRWSERWEFWVMTIFQIMLGLNLLRAVSENLSGDGILPNVLSQANMAITFELLNLLVIAIASGTAMLQRIGQSDGGGHHRGLVPGIRRTACSRRQHPPFTAV